jgi:hypothetical protein
VNIWREAIWIIESADADEADQIASSRMVAPDVTRQMGQWVTFCPLPLFVGANIFSGALSSQATWLDSISAFSVKALPVWR